MAGTSLAPTQAGATPNRLKRKAPESSAAATTSTSAGEDEAALAGDEEEVEDLEREVADLGRRILDHRRDAATRFLEATASRLAAFRPTACPEVPSERQSVAGTSHAEAEKDMFEKLKIFKSKTEANIAAMPKVFNKINECVAQMEKLEQLNVNIHPVFTRKR